MALTPSTLLRSGGAVLMTVALKSELDNIASGIDDELNEVMREQAEKMEKTAKSKIRSISGDLEKSVKVYVYGRAGKRGFRVGAGAKDEEGRPYGHMVEYGSEKSGGSRNAAAHPFMIPALEEHRQETIDALNDKIEEMAS